MARARFALAAAALLAACSVETDGAPCAAAGETAECPGGQACGNDLRCSARALACAASRCTPGVGGACVDPAGNPTTAIAHQCTRADPVCGAWEYVPCAAGLGCEPPAPAGRSAGAVCVCPPNPKRELLVAATGSRADAPPFATGAAAPPACAYRGLSAALAAAGAIVADPLAVATVTVTGAAAGATRTFSAAATGESFPLVVEGRVALRSDAAGSGGAYEILFDPSDAASLAVELHSGGRLASFTVRNGTGGPAADAVAIVCDGPDAAYLTSTTLEGASATGSRLGRGIVLTGGCTLAGADVNVRNVGGAGVLVDSPTADAGFTGGSITGSGGDGVSLRNGLLRLDRVRVADNGGMGIRGNDRFSGLTGVEIRGSKVIGNGDTGIGLISPAEVRITGTTVFQNGASPWGGVPPSGVTRRAGGVVLWGSPPAAASYELRGNRIYANAGDQVLLLGSGPASWSLDGGGCGADTRNLVGCYDPSSVPATESSQSYRGVVGIDANVGATRVSWSSATPRADTDFWTFGSGTLTMDAGCGSDATLSCASEDPQ